MGSDEAYKAILRALEGKPGIRIVSHVLDEANFGNFFIAFEERGVPRSILNDRGELVACNDLEGERGCVTAVQTLNDLTEQQLRQALRL